MLLLYNLWVHGLGSLKADRQPGLSGAHCPLRVKRGGRCQVRRQRRLP